MKRPYLFFGAALMAGAMVMSCGKDDALQMQTQEALEKLNQQIEELKSEQEQMRQELDDLSPIGEIFDNATVDVPASYPGGDYAMLKFIAANLENPESAIKDKIEGRTLVRILVDKAGEIKSCIVIKSLTPDCDREARRVCLKLQNFIPATQQGKPVSVNIVIPVTFKLP